MVDMPDRYRLRAACLAAAFVITACSGAGGAPIDASASQRASTQAPVASAAPAASAAPTAPVLDQPWAAVKLTDVTTGDVFRLADYAGSVIIIETMAIWCPNCLVQQRAVDAALAELGSAKVRYVVLDVDLNEDAAALADYRVKGGFTGTFVVAGIPVARALAEEFGAQILNPPLTPIIIVGTDGSGTLTDYGRKSSAEIVALARAAGA
jgi:thiol-disulfide isomerase/thioredoxin